MLDNPTLLDDGGPNLKEEVGGLIPTMNSPLYLPGGEPPLVL